ncbi:MAG: recombination protein O N-terminal domain-containing protein, partial [Lachnospiraceae bacterium]|nr:recombination protein O N-terminal domain-containing protein [Lachnospiraceae bacterium]
MIIGPIATQTSYFLPSTFTRSLITSVTIKILTVLTRDFGKQTVKAPGCRRKTSRLTAGSQLLVYSDLTINQRGDYLTLAEAD